MDGGCGDCPRNDALSYPAQYGYDSHIQPMRSTNIADLRNRLMQYLKEVRAGEEIIVRDRQRPIAKIVPFTVDEDGEDDADLVAAGVIRKGTGKLPRSFWSRRRRGGVPWEVAAAAVRADRDEN
jgi:prevent-host-death family protein